MFHYSTIPLFHSESKVNSTSVGWLQIRALCPWWSFTFHHRKTIPDSCCQWQWCF